MAFTMPPAATAAPAAADVEPPETTSRSDPPLQVRGTEASDEAVFLPNVWDVWWSEDWKCLVFYQVWTGEKLFEQRLAEAAIRAKGNGPPPRARLIDVEALRRAGELAGEDTPLDVDAWAAEPNGWQEYEERRHGRQHGVIYQVDPQQEVKIKKSFKSCSTTLAHLETIHLHDWDESQEWRGCTTESHGFAYVARTQRNVLKLQNLLGEAWWLPIDPLVLAVVENDLPFLRKCIASHRTGIDSRLAVNAADSLRRTPLCYAIEFDRPDCCVHLLNAGAKDTGITQAARHQLRVLLLALEGTDVDKLDTNMLNEEVRALQPEARKVAGEMLDAAAARRRREQVVRGFCRNMAALRLQKEDEEEELRQQRIQQERLRRQQRRLLEERLARAEAEELEAEVEAEQRAVIDRQQGAFQRFCEQQGAKGSFRQRPRREIREEQAHSRRREGRRQV